MKDTSNPPVIVILGQTASGKSALGIDAAQKFNGEILAADSRTIYKDMDIGTAKPSQQDQLLVPHHGLDLVAPDQIYSAAQFQTYAKLKINEIWQREHVPILVGGTGLYIDGLVYNFEFAEKPNPELRNKLNSLELSELQQYARDLGISENQVDFLNPRHLARYIERSGRPANRQPKPANVLLVGLQIPADILQKRIEDRVNQMMNAGFLDEVQNVIKKYGANAPALSAPGYKAAAAYINGEVSIDEAKEQFIRNDKQLAKRQKTWFKRNPDIVWCSTSEEALHNIRAFLSEFATIHTWLSNSLGQKHE